MKKKKAKKKTARKGKRKATRKTTKKAARKKTAKKPTMKNTSTKRETITITITNGIPTKDSVAVSKKKHQVKWRSTDKAYTLAFNSPTRPDSNPWPFTGNGNPPTIRVPAKKATKVFKVRASALESVKGNGYGYGVTPGPVGSVPLPIPEIIPDP